jgi:membrane protein required for colicin V production
MELSDLKNFDYIIMIIIAASVYFGWKAGFIESFISFFAWAGSAIIVFDNYSNAYSLVNGYIASKIISGFIASFVFYVILVMLTLYLGVKLSEATSKFGGGTIDKISGCVFGVIRGALIAIAVFWVCYISYYVLNDQKMPKWLSEAKSYKVLRLGSDFLSNVMSSEEERSKMLKAIKKKTKDSEEEVKGNIETRVNDFTEHSIEQN